MHDLGSRSVHKIWGSGALSVLSPTEKNLWDQVLGTSLVRRWFWRSWLSLGGSLSGFCWFEATLWGNFLLGNSASLWAFLYITAFPSWKTAMCKAVFCFVFGRKLCPIPTLLALVWDQPPMRYFVYYPIGSFKGPRIFSESEYVPIG